MADRVRKLYRGDCIDILREHIEPESVDLIYLDPPFNSNSKYNLPFKGKYKSYGPVEAFVDTWTWTADDDIQLAEFRKMPEPRPTLAMIVDVAARIEQMIGGGGGRRLTNSLAPYLLNMAERLLAMKRVMKPTASIYLHCDPTAEHYLKVVMDAVFESNFLNEIIWKRTTGKGAPVARKTFGNGIDTILFYSNGVSNVFRIPKVLPGQLPKFPHKDSNGRYRAVTPLLGDKLVGDSYFEWRGHNPVNGWRISKSKLEELHQNGLIHYNSAGKPFRKQYDYDYMGVDATNLWTDIPVARGRERFGYPTQKPLALLERIIKASSNKGDIVLDPFCGCGTTVHAAEELDRSWIGIDISRFAVELMNERVVSNFPHRLSPGAIEIVGLPDKPSDARNLARQDRFLFQRWACGKIGCHGLGKRLGKPGPDGGIDGIIELAVIRDGKVIKETAIVEVKSGNVAPNDVRALSEIVRRSGSVAGIMLCFEDQMGTVENQRSRETWSDASGTYPVIQGFSVEDLLAGKRPILPPRYGMRRGGRISA